MFKIENNKIHITRGDIGIIEVRAKNDDGTNYYFKKGEIIRLNVVRENDLGGCPLLTHESLMNIINGLYDIATAGVKSQQLILSSTNLAKLTAEEIAIATNKGWNVS